VRLVICDDELLFTDLLSQVMTDVGIEVVATSTDVESGLAQVLRHRPDVAIVDLRYPGGQDGLWLAEEIRLLAPDTRVVLLTASPHEVGAALRSGLVSAVVDKVVSLDRVVETVQRVVHDPTRPVSVVGEREQYLPVRARPSGRLRYLSPREREVLRGMVEGASTVDLAQALGVSVSTTRSHVQAVLSKLGVHSRIAAVRYASRRPSELVMSEETSSGRPLSVRLHRRA
jgi:two-component system, NarL family, nitrate/nitrite response regulator NarL